MRFVDDFVARRRAHALRSARSASETDLFRAIDDLVAMGPVAIVPVSECLSHGEARDPALHVLERLLTDATFDVYIALLASPNPTVVSGVSRVLCAGRGFTPRRLLAALKNDTLPRPTLRPLLDAHVASLPAVDLAAAFPGVSRDAQVALLRAFEAVTDPNLVPALAQLLGNEDAWVRGSLVRFLADRPGPGVIPGMIRLLRDSEKRIRLEAVHALHTLGAREAVGDLLLSLQDPDLKVQSAAIDALRELADVSAVPQLVDVLSHESEYVRRGAVEVLNEVATAEAIQDLVRALRDADWWVRVRAADALGTLGGETVVVAVAGLMQDPDDAVRRSAIEILNAVPDPSSLPTLVAALDDTDWWVRERAIDALGKTRDERAVDPLLAVLAREDATAILCVKALAAIGHPRTLRTLTGLLDSPLPDVRREAQVALQDFPRGELSSDDRSYLHGVLSRAGAPPTLTTAVPMRLHGPGTSGGLAVPFVPGPRETDGPKPLLRPALLREPTGTLGLNFADLAVDQELLGRYRIVRKIGRGGFGTVYLAHDEIIQEEIILKVLGAQLSMDESAIRRFVQELKLARKIAHRNVIRIHDFLDLGGTRAISMEYFPGRDLGFLLGEGGPLDVRRGLRIAAQVCDGLAAAHAEGVVHRDIKPANILVGDDDEARIVDFGLAAVQQGGDDPERLTKSGLLIGTPEYMAPEQISGEAVDHRADLYALGVVLYEMLSGIKPFTAETPVKVLFQHLEGSAMPLARAVPGIPDSVAELVMRAMARDPNQRPADAAALRVTIELALEALEVRR